MGVFEGRWFFLSFQYSINLNGIQSEFALFVILKLAFQPMAKFEEPAQCLEFTLRNSESQKVKVRVILVKYYCIGVYAFILPFSRFELDLISTPSESASESDVSLFLSSSESLQAFVRKSTQH